MEEIKNFFRVGSINYDKKGKSFKFIVSSQEDLSRIIRHFKKYKLLTKKRADFELWCKIIEIIKTKRHLTFQGLLEILAVRGSLNLGLSDKLKLAFPDVVPAERPIVELPRTVDPQ